MWQKILDWAKYFLKHKEQTEKNAADIKEQERTIHALTAAFQRLAFEQERQRENELHEREKMALRLENILLRAERGLPPVDQKSQVSTEELLRLIEALRQEVLLKWRREEQEVREVLPPQRAGQCAADRGEAGKIRSRLCFTHRKGITETEISATAPRSRMPDESLPRGSRMALQIVNLGSLVVETPT